ncbi:NAD(P)-dependent oxidoreductase [Marinobacter nanhaiticus D15-8W]|uniref:NAD(P)-dependent oxidoreductase n=1 Tax=Marinobacter nanhaiticus D15-8W TaxID=626887 RepID=N6W197_9GAMM|nr:NAD(P)-dependent oxidoreductase [Marinobacter nanhaiticus]ENO16280.1 NAD(P)-dependent oxidoreductase [Marinobacter nanhaiticus D15-8W]BES72862.1 NAD(P)-dependent oxidoreductase [Marinobacter nanhaiticus D15-8W]
MKVTFIGLGIMGQRMARNLLPHVDLTVWNRSPEPARILGEAGAQVADSPVDAVSGADVVFSMLASPEVVETLAFGEGGFLKAMAENSLWVDCSTVNPSFSRQSAAEAGTAGVHFMDGPVAGTRQPAEDGTLSFLIGGNQKDLDRVKPLLEHMGSKILHVGGHGQGTAFKMLVNAMLAQSMVVFSETALLGEKLGFDREMLMDTLPGLPVSAPFLRGKAELIRNGEFEAQFPLELMYKDLQLLDQTAYEKGHPLYLANAAKALFGSASAAGKGREDFAAIHSYLDPGQR